MKNFGYILVVLAILNFIVALIAISYNASEAAARKFGSTLMLGILGAYLIHRAKQKEQEKRDKENWGK